ncbi:MAG TPA: hypothetical protein VNM72_02665 [Blastocatellia bacterium]|nr:hypothetical protein [Blastocatellia bacterium]
MMVAAARTRGECGLTTVQIETVLSAFVLGYALLQIPGGSLVDGVRASQLGTLSGPGATDAAPVVLAMSQAI